MPRPPLLIASWNGGPATARAFELHESGTPLLDAIVEGIKLVEDDPAEMSVGYGGLPNEDGVVELDAAVMDGTLCRAGAVAGLRGVRHVASVARDVYRHTDHALIVGEGALKFARQLGYREENLLTDAARDAWLLWKKTLSTSDAWVGRDDDGAAGPSPGGSFGGAMWAGHQSNPTPGRPPEEAQSGIAPEGRSTERSTSQPSGGTPSPNASGGSPTVPFTFGTIHVSGLAWAEDGTPRLSSVTSTSGLSYKLPGRAGDSPIVGAGLYADDRAGAAGCTGRGEAALHSCAAFSVVEEMDRGLTPTEACLVVLRKMAARTRERRLLDAHGRPKFNVTLYAIRCDGELGSASMHEGYTHVRQEGPRTTVVPSAWVYGK